MGVLVCCFGAADLYGGRHPSVGSIHGGGGFPGTGSLRSDGGGGRGDGSLRRVSSLQGAGRQSAGSLYGAECLCDGNLWGEHVDGQSLPGSANGQSSSVDRDVWGLLSPAEGKWSFPANVDGQSPPPLI